MTSKTKFCKSRYDCWMLSLHNIIIRRLMYNWEHTFELAIMFSYYFWDICSKISDILKALMTLQLDYQCILVICFTRNNGSELERHFQIKKYYVRASSSKDHENTGKWFFMVLLCFFRSMYIDIYVRYVYMNEREMYVQQGREWYVLVWIFKEKSLLLFIHL